MACVGFFTGGVDDVGPKPTIAGYTDRGIWKPSDDQKRG